MNLDLTPPPKLICRHCKAEGHDDTGFEPGFACKLSKTLREIKQGATEEPERRVCSACMGTGIYDDAGSPPCGACNGTGLIKNEDEES